MERPAEDTDDGEDMWELNVDCDCPGPPPEFLLPPPPRPPYLQPAEPALCSSENSLPNTCDALPLIDASYRSNPSIQTSAVIVLCSVLLGLLVFIIVILVWKHKRKVQNFLPCKSSPQTTCEGGPTGTAIAAAVIYEDLHDVLPCRSTLGSHRQYSTTGRIAPTMEMIDVKNNIHYPSGYPMSNHPPVFLCSSPGPDPYCSQDLYNPVYEELSDGDSDSIPPLPIGVRCCSEDEFAEDELSYHGDGRRLSTPPSFRTRRPLPPLPDSKQHRRRRRELEHDQVLLDALLQICPPNSHSHIPSIDERLQCLSQGPYETVPVLMGHLATFRPVPKPYSQDSALGSDSGYSNQTSSRGSNRGRRDAARRLSQFSADLALT